MANGLPGCPSGAPGEWGEGGFRSVCRGYGMVTVLTNPDRVRLESKDEHGVVRLSYTVNSSIAGSSDTVPPTPPGDLVGNVISPVQADLSWMDSSDDTAVTGYIVYRDGSSIATVGSVTNYSDITAIPSPNHDFRVRAREAAATLPAQSTLATVTIPADDEAPTI